MHDHAEHRHSHGAGHTHVPQDFNRAFAIGVSLNLALVLAQLIFGLLAHSLALVADAGHNFTDVLGLVMAWWASRLAKSPPTKKHTYGLRSASILAALGNAIMLLVAMGAVAWEAIVRLKNPPHVEGTTVIWLATLGIVVNSVTALLFFRGRKEDLNVRGAFLHLAADAVISLGVVVAGFAILWTHRLWIDPVMSLLIVATIVYGTWGLFKDSVNLALQAVPKHIDRDAVEAFLDSLPGVVDLHDLHIWAMSTTQVALTVHLVLRPAKVDDSFLTTVAHDLDHKFGIEHSTIQIESESGPECQLAPPEKV